MKHIWWGTIALIAVFAGAWTALVIAGHPRQAGQVARGFTAAIGTGSVLLIFAFFFWIQDD